MEFIEEREIASEIDAGEEYLGTVWCLSQKQLDSKNGRPAKWTGWIQAFLRTNIKRLVQLGYQSVEQSSELTSSIATAAQATDAYMVTPMVVEIIARKL